MQEDINSKIVKLAGGVQKLVDAEFRKVNHKPTPGSNLDQLNLLAGDKVVVDFINNNEEGLAFEHLLYMIEESEIKVDDKILTEVMSIAKTLGVDISKRSFS